MELSPCEAPAVASGMLSFRKVALATVAGEMLGLTTSMLETVEGIS